MLCWGLAAPVAVRRPLPWLVRAAAWKMEVAFAHLPTDLLLPVQRASVFCLGNGSCNKHMAPWRSGGEVELGYISACGGGGGLGSPPAPVGRHLLQIEALAAPKAWSSHLFYNPGN